MTEPPQAALTIRPLEGGLGAELLGVAVAAIDDATFPAVHAAFLMHQLLLFRDQDLPPAAQVAFARRFGPVQVHVMNQYHASAYPELYTLSNLDENGRPSGQHPDRGTLAWHTDGSWQRVTGQATMLYAEQIPATGGGTHGATSVTGLGCPWRMATSRGPIVSHCANGVAPVSAS